MPKGIKYTYIFDFFNTTSLIVMVGSPMLLFLQHLRASATVLALAASLAPVLISLQIPAAQYVERIGYRRFALCGWTVRSFFVIGMALVAFMPETVDRTMRIVLMLLLSLVYTTLRGLSTCSMLPWFTHIVPEQRRGEFLAKDQSSIAVSTIVSLLFYGLLLRGAHAWYSFGIVFATSAVAAFVSLAFLKRIPDVPVDKISLDPNPLPWREMLFYPPFFRYLRYNAVITMALGVSGVFWVRYFRIFLHVSESNILFVNCASAVVLAGTLFLITPMIDRTGNKQVLMVSGIFLACHFAGWACVAAGVIPFGFLILAIQTVTIGIGTALWNIANVRAVMSIVPTMGRPHFLALYTVITSLMLGLIPLLWGPLMDSLEHWRANWGLWHWNAYSVLYCALTLNILIGQALLRSLEDPMEMTWDIFVRELLVETPGRAINYLIRRLRTPSNE